MFNLLKFIFYFRYLKCHMPNVYCTATAIKQADGSIEIRIPHTHEVNQVEYENEIAKKL